VRLGPVVTASAALASAGCRAGTLFGFPIICVILNTLFSYTAPQIFPKSGKQSMYEGTRATSCKCVLFNLMQFQMFEHLPL